MLEITKSALNELDALTPKVNPITQSIINAISYETVDPRMKAVIAVTQLMAFASQFRRNIALWDDSTEVPINAISFVITGSGAGKDSSVKAARKCFSRGYQLIETTRKKLASQAAIKAAEAAGEELPHEFEVYKSYMRPLPPIDITPTTGPGLTQHIADISDLSISSGLMYSGEFADELAYNPDMVENIKILSELYDLGDKESRYTKGAEFRTKAVTGQAVSALFVGSPSHILYDEATKKKFHVAFMSKLARRSWFCYAPERIPEKSFDSIEAFLAYKEETEVKSKQARAAMDESILQVALYHTQNLGATIKTSKEIFQLFETYKRYNSEIADLAPNQDSTSVLIRRHLQWKALKLSGAFAVMDKSDEITVDHYVQAIQFCELLDKDMEQFEHDLNKAAHERFSDFIRTQVDNETHKAIVNIHDIKKQGYLYNVSRPKLQELVILCSGYDASGIYSIVNEGGAIQYEPIIKTDVIGISFKPTDNTALNTAVASGDKDAISEAKQKIAAASAYGFEVVDTTFAQLSSLLEGDFAYSPFKFRNGTRGKDNILGGTKWLVLDVDDSLLSASEAHFMLSDINHHIALSSDPNNDYKFRVLVELDSPVELSPIAWKHFYLEIASDLALKVDPLPQSQIFFSYADRPILSVVDAEPLEIRTYAMNAKERAATKDLSASTLTSPQRRSLLADPLSTFHYLFDADNGAGSRSMYRAARHAQDLGASYEEIVNLLTDANNYWISPMPKDRFSKILKQVESLF